MSDEYENLEDAEVMETEKTDVSEAEDSEGDYYEENKGSDDLLNDYEEEADDSDSEDSDYDHDDDSNDEEPEDEESEEELKEPEQPEKKAEQPAPQQKAPEAEQTQQSQYSDEDIAYYKSFIPSEPEFFDACEKIARQKVEKDLGTEFDEYDTKHISRFHHYFNQESRRREAEYQQAVQRAEEKNKADEFNKNLDVQIHEICNTPELLSELTEVLNNLSHKAYLQLQEEIAVKRDGSKLIKLAKKVAGVHGDKVFNRPEKQVKAPVVNKRNHRGITGSDILGY